MEIIFHVCPGEREEITQHPLIHRRADERMQRLSHVTGGTAHSGAYVTEDVEDSKEVKHKGDVSPARRLSL